MTTLYNISYAVVIFHKRNKKYKNRWTHSVRINDAANANNAKDWCINNFGRESYSYKDECTGHNWYRAVDNQFFFSSKDDASLFLIIWG